MPPAKPIDALSFLAKPTKHSLAPVGVVFGDEAFLKGQVLSQWKQMVLGDDDGEFSLTRFDGNNAELRDVLDELATRAMFGQGQRLVIVDSSDPFVTRHRARLERYVERPHRDATLVLVADRWPTNTRLHKALLSHGLALECKFPPPQKLLKWLVTWARQRHDAQLDPAAAEVLAELVEPDLGLFDQELAKLGALAGGDVIDAELIQQAVGSWRSKTTWEMLDLAVAGNAREALAQLDRLLRSGEVPIALLGQVGSTLRRFAAATRLIEQAECQGRRTTLGNALKDAGMPPFLLRKGEGQLRQVGRVRGGQLYRWLLDADLALKREASAPARARTVLERLIVELSQARAPRKAQPTGRG